MLQWAKASAMSMGWKKDAKTAWERVTHLGKKMELMKGEKMELVKAPRLVLRMANKKASMLEREKA